MMNIWLPRQRAQKRQLITMYVNGVMRRVLTHIYMAVMQLTIIANRK